MTIAVKVCAELYPEATVVEPHNAIQNQRISVCAYYRQLIKQYLINKQINK